MKSNDRQENNKKRLNLTPTIQVNKPSQRFKLTHIFLHSLKITRKIKQFKKFDSSNYNQNYLVNINRNKKLKRKKSKRKII